MEDISVLDHGYVRFVESWGSDERIIEAARMSTGKGVLGGGPMCGRGGRPWRAGAVSCGPAVRSSSDPDFGVCQGGASEVKVGDEKLLRFLSENHHAACAEQR